MSYGLYLLKQLSYQLHRVPQIFKDEGIWIGSMRLAQIVTRIFYQRAEYLILTNSLSIRPNITNPKTSVIIRRVESSDDLIELGPITDPSDIIRFRKSLCSGSKAFIAYQNCQPVGYCWISFQADKTTNRLQEALHLHPGEAYFHDIFVLPEYRRNGVGQLLVDSHLRYLLKNGFQCAISAVYKDNTPALKLHMNMDYIPTGILHHRRIFLWDNFSYYDRSSELSNT